MRTITAAAGIAALLAAGCGTEGRPAGRSGSGNPPPVVTAASLERFDACPELLGHLRTEARKHVGPYGLPSGRSVNLFGGGTAVADAAAEAGAPAARSAAAPPSFSGTNVQEAGVDEPDIVKTDGRRILTLATDPQDGTSSLVYITVGDGKPRRAGTLRIPDLSSTNLLVAGDRALVIGTKSGGIRPLGAQVDDPVPDVAPGAGVAPEIAPVPAIDQTVIDVVDVSDPSAMRIVEVVKLDGFYVSARLIDGVARIVLNAQSTRIAFPSPAQGSEATQEQAVRRNREIVADAKLDDFMPRYSVTDLDGDVRSDGSLAACDSTYHPRSFSGFGTVSVVTIDPADPDPRNSATVLGDSGVVYASDENLYVATQKWADPVPGADEAPADAPIGAPEIAPVSSKTSIHRFDISDATRAAYSASGEVRGTVLNQWSISEHEGTLRVASTEDSFDGQGASSSKSFVTVLKGTGPNLSELGSVGDIGPGERIYGVRFMGDVGYVVTFRQVDPLHVVDLSKADRPRVVGELEIPGYSAYLHPVGEGLLLGVGQDATTEGGTLGTLVSLFDVSDQANPRRLDRVRLDDTHSPVEQDHHAFLYWAESSLAVIPVDGYAGGDTVVSSPDGEKVADPALPTSEAVGFRIDDGKITETGRASHARHIDPSTGQGSIQRAFVIDGTLYTLSAAGLLASDLDTFAESAWVAVR